MRIWSIHPKYLDVKRLVASWREGLLAKKVLEGNTKGYKNHSQLIRFKQHNDPVGAINQYLHYIADEGDRRGYKFNRSKLSPTYHTYKMDVSHGQLIYEMNHLAQKLFKHKSNIPSYFISASVEPNPFFSATLNTTIESWEKI